VHATVAGLLDLQPEPTIVAGRAHHRAELYVELDGTAEFTAAEHVLLGRTGEEPGRWTGTTRIERAGRPLLHTTVDLGRGAPAWLPPVAPRAYVSLVHLSSRVSEVATGDDVVRLPLPGGWITTAWGDALHRVTTAAEALDRPAAVSA
jgi:urease accessory protein